MKKTIRIEENKMNLDDRLEKALIGLVDSRKHIGQSLEQIIRGFSNQHTLTYWDYIKQDTLLSLQVPQTKYHDEKLFLIHHQIAELYLKLIIHELTHLINEANSSLECWNKHISRACQNLQIVISSLDILSDQLEHKEFSEFRLSLAPASGFQSFQFRYLELLCTPLYNLVSSDATIDKHSNIDLEDLYQNIYWKSAGRDLKTNKKSHMLFEFEKKYDTKLLDLAHTMASKNIWTLFQSKSHDIQADTNLQSQLRDLDYNFNITWSIKHYKLAAKHLRGTGSVDKNSTGSTNWRKFLPPKNQKISFFPGLWSTDEHSTWGLTKHLF
jgi:tryptophan 2,3-dioxygenase